MVDHLKKVKKSGVLDPGEQASAVLFVAPAGNTIRLGATAGVGGVIGVAAGEAARKKRAKKDAAEAEAAGHTTEGGLAAQVALGGQSYLTLTDRRWAVLSHGTMSGKPKEVLGGWEHADMASIEFTRGKLVGKARVVFQDGSVLNLDAPRGQKLEPFAEAAAGVGVAVQLD